MRAGFAQSQFQQALVEPGVRPLRKNLAQQRARQAEMTAHRATRRSSRRAGTARRPQHLSHDSGAPCDARGSCRRCLPANRRVRRSAGDRRPGRRKARGSRRSAPSRCRDRGTPPRARSFRAGVVRRAQCHAQVGHAIRVVAIRDQVLAELGRVFVEHSSSVAMRSSSIRRAGASRSRRGCRP